VRTLTPGPSRFPATATDVSQNAMPVREVRLHVVGRGLLVTNLGPMDEWLAPFGDHVLRAWVSGPSMSISPLTLVTVTGFRDRLTLSVSGFEEMEPILDRLQGAGGVGSG